MNPPKRSTLADYTKQKLIIPEFATYTTSSVMWELTTAVQRQQGGQQGQLSSSSAALIRELLIGASLEFGAAFPQVRVEAPSRPCFAMGRSSKPLHWRTAGFAPTDLVFLIIEPSRTDREFEQLVTTLHGLGKDFARLNDLRRAKNTEEMLAMLTKIPLVTASELARITPVPVKRQTNPARTISSRRRWRR